jgi:iron complex transport system substrate-binding protein
VRIVSLLPSATEVVYALGVDEHLVGVTFECDEPPRARVDKRVVVGGRDTTGMSPDEIDNYVRTQAAAGANLYTLDAGALAGLAPDLVLTQDLCWVCALPSATVDDALRHLGCSAEVLTLDPTSLSDVLDCIAAVAKRTGVPERGDALLAALHCRLARVAAAVATRPRPRVAVVEWVDPPFLAGHWVPDLVVAAGGQPVAALPGRRSRQGSWAEIAGSRPDVVVVAPCGYHLDAAAEQARAVASALDSAGGREIAVWAIDADGLVVRPGPRLVDGVEALAGLLHPGHVAARPDAVRRIR